MRTATIMLYALVLASCCNQTLTVEQFFDQHAQLKDQNIKVGPVYLYEEGRMHDLQGKEVQLGYGTSKFRAFLPIGINPPNATSTDRLVVWMHCREGLLDRGNLLTRVERLK